AGESPGARGRLEGKCRPSVVEHANEVDGPARAGVGPQPRRRKTIAKIKGRVVDSDVAGIRPVAAKVVAVSNIERAAVGGQGAVRRVENARAGVAAESDAATGIRFNGPLVRETVGNAVQ